MNNLQLNVNLRGSDNVSRPLRGAMASAKALAQQLNDTRNQLNQLNNTQKNVNSFIQLKKQFEDTKNKAKSLAIELKNAANPSKTLQREFNKVTAETKKLKDKLTPLRAELQQSGISTKNLAQHQVTLKSQIASANQSISQQSERLKQLNQRQQKANQIRSRYDTGMQRVAVLGGVGYGALATGRTVARSMKNLLHVGYEFDASMSSTQAVTRIDDKNDPRMIALRKQARELPLVSKFTDSEVAQGQFFLGRTGYDADQILKATPHMLNLAAAGDLDLPTSADIASNIQKAMRIPAEEMGQVSDVLTAAFTRNNVDIPMLGESLKYTAGISRQYGQSLETITAATALLGNAQVQGSQAGTSLRQILIRIGNSAAVKKLGVKTADKNGNMRDLGDIFEEIQKATAKMGNLQRGTIYKNIAGQVGITGFTELMKTVETGEFQAMRHNLYNSKGEAEKVAKIKLDNLAGDMTMLHAAFENISVELFEKNNDWLRATVQGLTNFLHGVSEFLKKHPAISKALVMIGAGLAVVTAAFGGLALILMSVFGPMLMTRFILSRLGLSLGGLFIKSNVAKKGFSSFGQSLLSFILPGKKTGSILKSIGSALLSIGKSPKKLLFSAIGFTGLPKLGALFGKSALLTRLPKVFGFVAKGLGIALGPIGWIITAATLLYKYWQPVSAFFIGFWKGLRESLSATGKEFGFLKPTITAIGNVFKWVGRKISDLINWFSDLFEPMKLTNDEFKKVENAGESFGKSFSKVISLLTKIFNPLGQSIIFVAGLISKYWQPISTFFIGFWDGLCESLANIWDELSFLMPVIRAVGAAFKWVGSKISDLINWFDNLFQPVQLTTKELSDATASGKTFGTSVGNAVRTLIRMFRKLYNIIESVINFIISIPDRIRELPKKIEEIFTGENGLFSKFTKIGSDISDGLVTGINNKWDETKKAVTDLGTNVSSWFKNTLDIHSPSRVFAKFGGYTIDGYIHGIEHNQSDALRSMSQLGTSIGNRFKNALDIHSPSRLFAKFGDHTVGGYIDGIDRNQSDVLRSMSRFADNTITGSAQLNNGVIIDHRRPIGYTGSGSQYYITINAAPGMDEQTIARKVAQEIERRERNQSARYRSSLRDID